MTYLRPLPVPACLCGRACRRRRIVEWAAMGGGEARMEILDTAEDGSVALCADYHFLRCDRGRIEEWGAFISYYVYQAWHHDGSCTFQIVLGFSASSLMDLTLELCAHGNYNITIIRLCLFLTLHDSRTCIVSASWGLVGLRSTFRGDRFAFRPASSHSIIHHGHLFIA